MPSQLLLTNITTSYGQSRKELDLKWLAFIFLPSLSRKWRDLLTLLISHLRLILFSLSILFVFSAFYLFSYVHKLLWESHVMHAKLFRTRCSCSEKHVSHNICFRTCLDDLLPSSFPNISFKSLHKMWCETLFAVYPSMQP